MPAFLVKGICDVQARQLVLLIDLRSNGDIFEKNRITSVREG